MLWLLPVRWLMKVGFMAAPGAMWCLSLESLGLQPSGTCWSSLLDSSWTAVLHAVLGRCATMALASHPTSTWPALFAGHLPQHLWGVQVQLGKLTGFLPYKLLDPTRLPQRKPGGGLPPVPARGYQELVGQPVKVKVTQVGACVCGV